MMMVMLMMMIANPITSMKLNNTNAGGDDGDDDGGDDGDDDGGVCHTVCVCMSHLCTCIRT